MNSESPTLTNEDDVDDLLGKVEDISENSAASREVTNAQSNVLEDVILNLNSMLKSVSDMLAKITPAAQLGGSTSADSADGPTQPSTKRLKLDAAPSNNTDDTELEITDDVEKSGRCSEDYLLSGIERDFAQEEEEGLNVDTKLADIVNKHWPCKLTDSKLKEKCSLPGNCQRLQVPRVNPEIWSKLPHQAKQQDLQMPDIQKPGKGWLLADCFDRNAGKTL